MYKRQVLGGAWGVLARLLADSSVFWLHDAAADVAVWLTAVAGIGRIARSARQAAALAAGFLLAAVAADYGFGALALREHVDRGVLLWVGTALTVAPAVAALTQVALRRRGPLGGLVLAVLAGGVLVDGSVQQLLLHAQGQLPDTIPMHVPQAVLDAACVLVLLLALPRSWSTRCFALLLAVPCLAFLPGALCLCAYATGLVD